MKAEELRLWNLFDYHGQIVFVLAIKRTCAEYGYFKDSIGFERNYTGAFNDSPKPIPITEEWLRKFGFEYEKQTVGGYERWEIKSPKGGKIKFLDKKFTWDAGEYSTYILYVHELQNIYFALTGKELELKNNG